MVLRYVGKIHQTYVSLISTFHLLLHLQPPFAAELVKTFVDFVQQME